MRWQNPHNPRLAGWVLRSGNVVAWVEDAWGDHPATWWVNAWGKTRVRSGSCAQTDDACRAARRAMGRVLGAAMEDAP